jgi:tRNA-dihydrouridine synthase B
VQEKGEYIAVREMRKHTCWYIKNLKDSSKVREKINHMESISEVINSLEEYFKTL